MTIPDKIKEGDSVQVITPSRSLSMPWITEDVKKIAIKRFSAMGLNLSFGEHVNEINRFNSSSIESRVKDIHDAFRDPSVKLVITVIGGYNSGELLPYLDYDLIKANPKILCGYSDITALENGIFAKTGLVTYSGPHFFDFGELNGFDYTLDYFKKCLISEDPFEVKPSKVWSNDLWGLVQNKRTFENNQGFYIMNDGKAEGTIFGGNLVTFHSLQGTAFSPQFHENTILFLEEDDEETVATMSRNLNTIIMREDFDNVKGIVFGRLKPESKITLDDLKAIVQNNKKIQEMPIISGVDFGHTTPKITFPIGGTVGLSIRDKKVRLKILKH